MVVLIKSKVKERDRGQGLTVHRLLHQSLKVLRMRAKGNIEEGDMILNHQIMIGKIRWSKSKPKESQKLTKVSNNFRD